jgi:hypothetical protein
MIYFGFLVVFLLGFYLGFLACAIFCAGKIKKASMNGGRRTVTILLTRDVTDAHSALRERHCTEMVEDRRETDPRRSRSSDVLKRQLSGIMRRLPPRS